MTPIGFFYYFGMPSLFLLLCMGVVGWIRFRKHRIFVPLRRWIVAWGLTGYFVASLLAITAWGMDTDFVYNNASLVWPFCLTLVALNGHPSMGVGLLVVALMGLINGLYYALLAALSLVILRVLPLKSDPQ